MSLLGDVTPRLPPGKEKIFQHKTKGVIIFTTLKNVSMP